MAKLDRIIAELEKSYEKIQELQERCVELEQQRTEEENAMIIQMVRKQKMTPAELGKFLDKRGDSITNPTKTPPVSPGSGNGPGPAHGPGEPGHKP